MDDSMQRNQMRARRGKPTPQFLSVVVALLQLSLVDFDPWRGLMTSLLLAVGLH